MLISDLEYLEVVTEETDEVLGGACTTKKLNNYLIKACAPVGKPTITITLHKPKGKPQDDDDDDDDD